MENDKKKRNDIFKRTLIASLGAFLLLLLIYAFYVSGTTFASTESYEQRSVKVFAPAIGNSAATIYTSSTDKQRALEESTSWYRDHLTNDSERRAYDSILDGLYQFSYEISMPDSTSGDTAYKCYQYVMNDHPEIFWVDNGYQYTYLESNNMILSIRPNYLIDEQQEIVKVRNDIDTMIKDTITSLQLDNKSDYEKAKAIYDHLIDTVRYDAEAQNNQNIMSTFFNKATACAGYSKAYQLLCAEAGIPCIYMTGPAGMNDEEKILHAWNAIMIGDERYYVDCTWGDKDGKLPTDYTWLCLTYDDMMKTHEPDATSIAPEANDSSLEIWTLSGTDFPIYDLKTVEAKLSESIDNRRPSITMHFTNADDWNKCYEELLHGNVIAQNMFKAHADAFPKAFEEGIYKMYSQNNMNAITIVWKYD